MHIGTREGVCPIYKPLILYHPDSVLLCMNRATNQRYTPITQARTGNEVELRKCIYISRTIREYGSTLYVYRRLVAFK